MLHILNGHRPANFKKYEYEYRVFGLDVEMTTFKIEIYNTQSSSMSFEIIPRFVFKISRPF